MSTPTKLPDGRRALWHWYLVPLLRQSTDPIERIHIEMEIKAQQARVRALWRDARALAAADAGARP